MKVVVVGGNGFLGTHLVNYCINEGYETVIFDLNIDKSISNSQATFFKGSIINYDDIKNCLQGVEVVFHCASPPEFLLDNKIYNDVNIVGTKNLLKACKEEKVKRLILTSSASVVYERQDIYNGDENMTYAKLHVTYYIKTKIEQEKMVLNSNYIENDFRTLVIRPHGIFGPGDKLLVPQTLKAAKEGKLKYIIGNGTNIVDFTYVENIAYAMVLASKRLAEDTKVAGQVFNITNIEPVYFWTFIGNIAEVFGYKAPKKHLPYYPVYYIACIFEFISWLLKPIKTFNFTFSPQKIALCGTHHFYSCQKAIDLLKYKPLFDMKTGFEKMCDYFKNQQHNGSS